jgi:hypothetical protein
MGVLTSFDFDILFILHTFRRGGKALNIQKLSLENFTESEKDGSCKCKEINGIGSQSRCSLLKL